MHKGNTRLRWTVITSVALAVALVGLLGSAARSQESDSVELAFTGDFLGSRTFPESGSGWFAVRQTPTGMTLTETRIEVNKVPNACSGTATRITAMDVNEPLFLVRGLSAFQSGPLDSVFEERRFIYPAEEFSMKLASGRWFGFKAYGSAAPAVGEVRVSDYEIHLNQGTRTQTLAEFPLIAWDGPPNWFGPGTWTETVTLTRSLTYARATLGMLRSFPIFGRA